VFDVEQVGLPAQSALVVLPVAVYFLLLGLLNSRPRPQLLAARTDFLLLNGAFFPAFCVPVVGALAASAWALPLVLGAVVGLMALLAPPRGGGWVIYNITLPQTLRALERALRATGEPFRREGRQLVLTRRDARFHLTAPPLLRNVSVWSEGPDRRLIAELLEPALRRELGRLQAQPNPAALTFLLIATAMLVAPLGLFADRMPEMVRLITALVK